MGKGQGWVSHLGVKFSPFFSSGQKLLGSKIDRPLIYCGLEVCLDWVSAHLYLKAPPPKMDIQSEKINQLSNFIVVHLTKLQTDNMIVIP